MNAEERGEMDAKDEQAINDNRVALQQVEVSDAE